MTKINYDVQIGITVQAVDCMLSRGEDVNINDVAEKYKVPVDELAAALVAEGNTVHSMPCIFGLRNETPKALSAEDCELIGFKKPKSEKA